MRLDVKNLNFGYTKKVQILHNINFSVESGQLVSLIGPNGSGKTTIIKCINQILSPQSGQIFLDGTNVHTMRTMELAKKVGYVPQMTKNFMGGTVLDAVLMGRRPYIKWKITDYDVTLVLEILKKLEITHLAHKEYEALSGGQKQKVLIARALAQNPDVYLFDEPTSFLDIKNQLEIMNMAKELVHQHHKLVIMVAVSYTHLDVYKRQSLYCCRSFSRRRGEFGHIGKCCQNFTCNERAWLSGRTYTGKWR